MRIFIYFLLCIPCSLRAMQQFSFHIHQLNQYLQSSQQTRKPRNTTIASQTFSSQTQQKPPQNNITTATHITVKQAATQQTLKNHEHI